VGDFGLSHAAAAARVLLRIHSKSRAELSSSYRRARYFSFACPKEKYPRENDTPLTRLAGIGQPLLRCLNSGIHALAMPARSACGLRGLSTGHPALTPNWPASMPATLRAFPPPARRFRGAPGKATRILRVFFRRARSTADQEQSRGRTRFALALAFELLSFQLFTECGPRRPAALPGAPVRR